MANETAAPLTTPHAGDRQHVPTDQAAPELLPCPFCGGKDVSVFGPVGWYRQFGITHSCRVFFNGSGDFTVGSKSRKGAIADWNRRADLAAPSAPTEVDGLSDTQKIERMAELNWKPASEYWKEQHDAKAAALSAQQADNERLRGTAEFWENCAVLSEKRAEKAEAERDAWKANAEALSDSIYAVYPDERAESALAAHAKLKGEV